MPPSLLHGRCSYFMVFFFVQLSIMVFFFVQLSIMVFFFVQLSIMMFFTACFTIFTSWQMFFFGQYFMCSFQRVSDVRSDSWLQHLLCPPYLQNSVMEPFLLNYFPDGVGLSPIYSKKAPKEKTSESQSELKKIEIVNYNSLLYKYT